VNEKRIKKDSLLFTGDFIGKTGVKNLMKKSWGKRMKYIQKESDRNIGSYKNGSLDKDVITGKDITLTIDYDLQRMLKKCW
jgi:penicillin-binding protein 2